MNVKIGADVLEVDFYVKHTKKKDEYVIEVK